MGPHAPAREGPAQPRTREETAPSIPDLAQARKVLENGVFALSFGSVHAGGVKSWLPCGAVVAATLFLAGAAPAQSWRAPHFKLDRLTDGEVALTDLLGEPFVFVVGSTREAAPDCKEWMLILHKNFERSPTNVFQVAVLDNPWYLPHFAVRGMIRDFVPDYGHRLVLLEWGTEFGVRYGIPKDNTARVLVGDRQGMIRAKYEGTMNDERLVEVLNLVTALEHEAPAAAAVPQHASP